MNHFFTENAIMGMLISTFSGVAIVTLSVVPRFPSLPLGEIVHWRVMALSVASELSKDRTLESAKLDESNFMDLASRELMAIFEDATASEEIVPKKTLLGCRFNVPAIFADTGILYCKTCLPASSRSSTNRVSRKSSENSLVLKR